MSMGLDTSHNCWHGAYSAFMRWRQELAKVAGIPPLDLMEGFYTPNGMGDLVYWARKGLSMGEESFKSVANSLPIKWECLKPSALHELLYHSDCDGEIPADRCGAIADELEKLIPLLPGGDGFGHIGNWRDKTQQFIDGLRDAAAKNEPVNFH